MRKEIFIAIIIGFGLGLAITYGIWKANRTLQSNNTQTIITPTPQVQRDSALQNTPSPSGVILGIIDPVDNSIVKTENITLKGKTTPQAQVGILYGGGEKIVEADIDGNFTADITLSGGNNEITVTAFDKDGNQNRKIINVTYTTAEI